MRFKERLIKKPTQLEEIETNEKMGRSLETAVFRKAYSSEPAVTQLTLQKYSNYTGRTKFTVNAHGVEHSKCRNVREANEWFTTEFSKLRIFCKFLMLRIGIFET